MDKIRGHKVIKVVKILLVILFIAIVYYFLTTSSWIKTYLEDPNQIKDFVLSFGYLAPLMITLLQAIQNIVPFLPHEITAVAAGFIFGPVMGIVYTLIGAFIGSAVVFQIARKYGKKLAEKVFDKKEVVHFNLMFKKNKAWTIFIARLVPLFPNDLVSFAAGLTNIKFMWFNIVSTLGFVLEVVILSYFGSSLTEGISIVPIIILVAFLGTSSLVVVFKKQIKRLLIKDLHRLEKDGKIIEKEIEKEFKKI
ncbi:MAG: TVP38/TMEM64 family protein [Candidatus Woesearchaeota archaeon]